MLLTQTAIILTNNNSDRISNKTKHLSFEQKNCCPNQKRIFLCLDPSAFFSGFGHHHHNTCDTEHTVFSDQNNETIINQNMACYNPRYSFILNLLLLLLLVRIPGWNKKNISRLTTFLLIFITIISSQIVMINAHKLTERDCNRTAFEENGCEEPKAMKCVNVDGRDRCACLNDSDYVLMGRFCVPKLCSSGQYYDRDDGKCVRQRKASTDVAENHCRFDYHCFGKHVSCRKHGWNYNCVCDKGFIYDSLSSQCIPKFGIGGHCMNDKDCDETNLRKIRCLKITDGNGKNSSSVAKSLWSSSSSSTSNQQGADGTCQCIDDHQYSYNIDGCESVIEILSRGSNFRSLILLFVIFGLLFGFAMTFNFGLFSGSSRPDEMYMQRLEAEKRIRKIKQRQAEREANGKIFDDQPQPPPQRQQSEPAQEQPADSELTSVDGTAVNHQSSIDDKNVDDHHQQATIIINMEKAPAKDDKVTSLIAL